VAVGVGVRREIFSIGVYMHWIWKGGREQSDLFDNNQILLGGEQGQTILYHSNTVVKAMGLCDS